MHRVASTGNTANAVRPQRERRLSYLITDSDDSKHCSTVNCLSTSSSLNDSTVKDSLFTGSRDGTLKRWDITGETAACCATFESHTDWVNDAVLMGDTLVSCSSDSTIKTWGAFSDGRCTKTLRQHSDYVLSLAVSKHTNSVASGGLGGEVFVWDLEAANVPLVKYESGIGQARAPGQVVDDARIASVSNKMELQGFKPIAAKGHKESVYAVAMNHGGTVLVSGGTEKALRVWDPRSGTKCMKLRGHTDNIRALAIDDSGRYCLSGSSDSMIRLWDLGQQRCVHSYAVHTDSVWALQANSLFTCVYSGGRDSAVYLTDLNSRESSLVCSEKHPVLSLVQDGVDWLWVATSESPVHKWSTKYGSQKPSKSTFLAGTLPFARARACLEGLPPIPMGSEPSSVIPVSPSIVQHTVLNDKRHILTKDTAGFVKLWEITTGVVKSEFGKVSFEDKEKELFEMVSVPAWFAADIRLGCLSIHLETPQCFSAEMYAVDVPVCGASEELKINLGQETLRGLFSHRLSSRDLKKHLVSSVNGDLAIGSDVVNSNGCGAASNGSLLDEKTHKLVGSSVFQYSSIHPPSIIIEDLQGGLQRRKLTDLDGSEDEKELPTWCLDCLLNEKIVSKENTKCGFYLHPYEGTNIQVPALGKLSAPRILRVHKVITYVLEKMVLDKPIEETNYGAVASNHGQLHTINGKVFRTGTRYWQQKKKFSVDILCNNQVLRPELSLATVRQYIWKKPDDLYLHYKITPEQ